jgi:hypothetical protein
MCVITNLSKEPAVSIFRAELEDRFNPKLEAGGSSYKTMRSQI